MKGHLFILSSPSGGGKTSIGETLSRRVAGLVRSVSMTTRRPRRGEKEGRDYFFVSKAAFEAIKRRRGLWEWTTYDGNRYGTPRAQAEELLGKGKDLLLLLDIRGALALKRRLKQATTVFVMPPSLRELTTRLSRRKTEDRFGLSRRLRIAKRELVYAKRYDHVVINDRLAKVTRAIERIIRKTRSHKKR